MSTWDEFSLEVAQTDALTVLVKRLAERDAEIERLRAVLGAIARTVFSGDEMGEDYQRGNREAHETCARVALGALGRIENKEAVNARRTR